VTEINRQAWEPEREEVLKICSPSSCHKSKLLLAYSGVMVMKA